MHPRRVRCAPAPRHCADDDDDDDDDDDEVPAAAGSKRKGAYVDPSAKRAKGAGGKAAATKATAKPAATPRDPTATAAAAQAKAAGAAARRQERAAAAREGGGPAKTIQRGSLRASTIKASVEASEERLRQQAAAAKQPKQPGGARRKEFRRLTQDELLAEARQTEIINRASLEAMLRMEEAKRVVHAKSRAPAGPRVRTHSKAGRTTLTFIEMGSVPEAIRASAPVPPPPARCVITGLPAKYRDPQTGTPYATLDAFRTIRGRGRSRSQTYGPGAQAAL